jgi:hypothetical protein
MDRQSMKERWSLQEEEEEFREEMNEVANENREER